MSSRRVVVVLGFSDDGAGEIHPVCAARLARAAEIATEEDVVVLSGWARSPHSPAEAELMRRAWTGRAGRRCRLFSPADCGPGRPLSC